MNCSTLPEFLQYEDAASWKPRRLQDEDHENFEPPSGPQPVLNNNLAWEETNPNWKQVCHSKPSRQQDLKNLDPAEEGVP